MRFIPIYGRQAFKVDGKFKFWGGVELEAVGGGPGSDGNANGRSAQTRHHHPLQGARAGFVVRRQRREGGAHRGHDGVRTSCEIVVLACGGFEANADMRTRYLGPGWDLAKVRGSRFNTGDGIRMALDDRRSAVRQLVGLPRVQWDMNAPEFGDLAVGDQFQKHSYPFGILINAHGQALCRRGRRFPQLHLCEVRRAWCWSSRQVRLADFRPEGRSPATRRIPDQAGHQGVGEHARGVRATSSMASNRGRIPRDCSGMQRSRAASTCRLIRTSRMAGVHRVCRQQNQLGEHHRPRRPLRVMPSTCGVTFTFGGCASTTSAGDRHRLPARSLASMPQASWLVASSISIIRAAPGSCPALYLVRSPAHQPGARRHKLKYTRDQVRAQPSGSLPSMFATSSNAIVFAKYRCHAQTLISHLKSMPLKKSSPARWSNLTSQTGKAQTPGLKSVACVSRLQATISGHVPKLVSILLLTRGTASAGGPTHLAKAPRRDRVARCYAVWEMRRLRLHQRVFILSNLVTIQVKEREQWTISSIVIRRSSAGQSSLGRTVRVSLFTSA